MSGPDFSLDRPMSESLSERSPHLKLAKSYPEDAASNDRLNLGSDRPHQPLLNRHLPISHPELLSCAAAVDPTSIDASLQLSQPVSNGIAGHLLQIYSYLEDFNSSQIESSIAEDLTIPESA